MQLIKCFFKNFLDIFKNSISSLATTSLPRLGKKMTTKCTSSVSSLLLLCVTLACNKPLPRASIALLRQCVCCHEWDLLSHTESQDVLNLVLAHPSPSPTTLHVCVCVCYVR